MQRSFLLIAPAAIALLFTPACERISAEKVFPEYMSQKKAAQKEALKEIETQNNSAREAPAFFRSSDSSKKN